MATRTVRPNGRALAASGSAFAPLSEQEQAAVRRQLDRILLSPAFHNSRRYAAVLAYIVEQTLQGAGTDLKERTIGVEVFQRAADYDTATDHVVRSAVAEVRKRLAQYYQDEARHELKIEVLPGSYIPRFRPPDTAQAASIESAPGSETLPVQALPAQTASKFAPLRARTRMRETWVAVSLLAVVAAAALLVASAVRPIDAFDGFWRPVVASRAPVLICVGNLQGGRESDGDSAEAGSVNTLKEFHSSANETVHIYDAMTLAKFAGLMQSKGKEVRLASQSDATFTDLQNGPAILVGLMNNDWTERLMPTLRFTVEHPTPARIAIRDRNNPGKDDWAVDYSTPYLSLTKDYALVLRMVDPKTEQVVIVAAGITVFGTFAAGDFLTSKSELSKLAAVAPSGWEKKNMELVLATDVIRGRSGPARIVAAQFW